MQQSPDIIREATVLAVQTTILDGALGVIENSSGRNYERSPVDSQMSRGAPLRKGAELRSALTE